MRPETFHADALVQMLRRRTVATMADMKAALGTRVDMTVFRKLRTVDYLTSYSHGGRFYTLRELAEFDARGLWSYREARFSMQGSLVDTAESFVLGADAGAFASDLSAEVGVETKEALLKLVRDKRVSREQIAGLYLYCSPDSARRRQQVMTRRAMAPEEPFGEVPRSTSASDETRAALILFLSLLNEKERRLFAGLESLRLGRGGDQRVADWTGLDVHTVARGRHELLASDVNLDRIRQPGAGRRPAEKKSRWMFRRGVINTSYTSKNSGRDCRKKKKQFMARFGLRERFAPLHHTRFSYTTVTN